VAAGENAVDADGEYHCAEHRVLALGQRSRADFLGVDVERQLQGGEPDSEQRIDDDRRIAQLTECRRTPSI